MSNILQRVFSPEVFRQSLFRFPLALASAFIAAILFMIIIHGSELSSQTSYFITRIILLCLLAFPLFFGLRLYRERQNSDSKIATIYNILATVFLLTFYFYFPQEEVDFSVSHASNVALLTGGFTIASVAAPFVFTSDTQGFWQFIWKLFLRGVISTVFAGIIFAGISAALAAINFLLKVDVDSKIYGDIWILSAAVFAPWFFLGGVPQNFPELETDQTYPKLLEVFTKFILLPLTAVYIVILVLYGLKVLITGDWPDGSVVYTIASFVVPSILTVALLFPLRSQKWIPQISVAIFASILPLMGLYFAAIWFRLADYGVTESRYLVVMFGVWVVGISLYYLISKNKLLKILPISAATLLILASFGPWGMTELSKNNQLNRLESVLVENRILVNGKVQKASEGEVTKYEAVEITETVEYLRNTHGLDTLKPWYTDEQWESLTENKQEVCFDCSPRGYISTSNLLEVMGVDYTSRWELEENSSKENNQRFSLYGNTRAEQTASLNIQGYDEFIRLRHYNDSAETDNFTENLLSIDYEDGSKIDVIWEKESLNNKEYLILKQSGSELFKIDMLAEAQNLIRQNGGCPGEYCSLAFQPNNNLIEVSNSDIRLKIVVVDMSGYRKNTRVATISNLEANIFLDLKQLDS